MSRAVTIHHRKCRTVMWPKEQPACVPLWRSWESFPRELTQRMSRSWPGGQGKTPDRRLKKCSTFGEHSDEWILYIDWEWLGCIDSDEKGGREGWQITQGQVTKALKPSKQACILLPISDQEPDLFPELGSQGWDTEVSGQGRNHRLVLAVIIL